MSVADIIIVALLGAAIIVALAVAAAGRKKAVACLSGNCASCSNRCHCKH